MVNTNTVLVGGAVAAGAYFLLGGGGSKSEGEQFLDQRIRDAEDDIETCEQGGFTAQEAHDRADMWMNEVQSLADEYPDCKDQIEGQPINGNEAVFEKNYLENNQDAVTGCQRLKYWAQASILLRGCKADKEGYTDSPIDKIKNVVENNTLASVLTLAAVGIVGILGGWAFLVAVGIGGAVYVTVSEVLDWVLANKPGQVKDGQEYQTTETTIDDYSPTDNPEEETQSITEPTVGGGTQYSVTGSFRAAVYELREFRDGSDVVYIGKEASEYIPYETDSDIRYLDPAVRAIASPVDVGVEYIDQHPEEAIVLAWAYIAAVEGTLARPIFEDALATLPPESEVTEISFAAAGPAVETIKNNIEDAPTSTL